MRHWIPRQDSSIILYSIVRLAKGIHNISECIVYRLSQGLLWLRSITNVTAGAVPYHGILDVVRIFREFRVFANFTKYTNYTTSSVVSPFVGLPFSTIYSVYYPRICSILQNIDNSHKLHCDYQMKCFAG